MNKVVKKVLAIAIVAMVVFATYVFFSDISNEIRGLNALDEKSKDACYFKAEKIDEQNKPNDYDKDKSVSEFLDIYDILKPRVEFRFLPTIMDDKTKVQYTYFNKMFYDAEQFLIEDGEGFILEDFKKTDDLNVLVGYKLKDKYKLSERYDLNILGEKISCRVKGILTPGSKYASITNNNVELDEAIIVPFEEDFIKQYFEYPELIMSYENMIFNNSDDERFKEGAVYNTDIANLEVARLDKGVKAAKNKNGFYEEVCYFIMLVLTSIYAVLNLLELLDKKKSNKFIYYLTILILVFCVLIFGKIIYNLILDGHLPRPDLKLIFFVIEIFGIYSMFKFIFAKKN